MAKTNHRLLIYDRREMTVLILLGVMVALFAFTLGVHLAKRVGGPVHVGAHGADSLPAGTTTDKIPEPGDLTEQSKGAQNAVDDTMEQALHDEVQRSGLKLDQSRQVDLPRKARAKAEPEAAEPAHAAEAHAKAPEAHEAHTKPAAPHAEAATGKFTLQVGSHPNIQEANEQLAQLQKKGLPAFLSTAEIKGKGVWHRVFIGGYETKPAAEKAGQGFREQKLIESFVVNKNGH